MSEFNTRINEATPGYYDISYELKRNVTWLGMNIGKKTISVTIQDGQYPEYPYYKIKNPDAINDVRHSIKTYSYFRANKLGSWLNDTGQMTAALSGLAVTLAVALPIGHLVGLWATRKFKA